MTVVDPHQNYSDSWSTPTDWVEWARRTLGGEIDLDPCTSRAAQRRIRARRFFTRGGLSRHWDGAVFVNPPGSNSTKSVKEWWEKAVRELEDGYLQRLVWVAFNFEQVRILEPSMLSIPGALVLPRLRVAYLRDGKPMKSPRNYSVLWCFGCEPDPEFPIPSKVLRTG